MFYASNEVMNLSYIQLSLCFSFQNLSLLHMELFFKITHDIFYSNIQRINVQIAQLFDLPVFKKANEVAWDACKMYGVYYWSQALRGRKMARWKVRIIYNVE